MIIHLPDQPAVIGAFWFGLYNANALAWFNPKWRMVDHNAYHHLSCDSFKRLLHRVPVAEPGFFHDRRRKLYLRSSYAVVIPPSPPMVAMHSIGNPR